MPWGGARQGRRAAMVASAAVLAVLALPASASAVAYVDVDGHTINVDAPSLPPDPARDREFVDLLGSLVHRDEMNGVTVHLANQQEFNDWCGPSAGACVTHDTIHVPGSRTASELRVTLAHEYGHIVHQNRLNPPTGTIRAGTKRWATYEGICQGLRAGLYGEFDYYKMPREAFAQAYATLNFPDTPWGKFDESLRPDASALDAIRQDVLDPWQPTIETLKGKLTRSASKRTYELVLPLDGILSANLTTARGLAAKVSLIVGGAKVSSHRRPVEYEICGERAGLLRVSARKQTVGKFKVRLVRP